MYSCEICCIYHFLLVRIIHHIFYILVSFIHLYLCSNARRFLHSHNALYDISLYVCLYTSDNSALRFAEYKRFPFWRKD